MGGTRVLLCDEGDDLLLMLSMELGFHEDIEVVGAAHDGRKAVELTERSHPDVVVLDLDLPVVGGVDALRRIMQVRPEARVVVLVGPDSERLASHALRIGARRSVERDAEPHRIVRVIREVIDEPEHESAGQSDPPRVLVGGRHTLSEEMLEDALRASGSTAVVVSDEAGLMASIHQSLPDLIILDAEAPGMSAHEISRKLRSSASTRDIPIVMLLDRSLDPTVLARVTAGANDYVIKPFDAVELRMRATSALRRAYELSSMNPLTYLPGNVQIEMELRRRAASKEPFALLYVDLDDFKAYNDHYGWLRGDEVIRLEASCAVDSVRRNSRDGFVGHVGGDDVVAIVEATSAEPVARDIVGSWDRLVPPLYDPSDAERGYLEVPDRLGEMRRFPLSSISIGIASNLHRPFTGHWEASEVATEMKRFAKLQTGSAYAFDRRAGGERRREESDLPPYGDRRRRIIRLDG